MDYIILNNDGSLQKQSLTRYINQGSHGADKIFIGWANGLATDILQVVFTLPNQTTNTVLGEFESDYNYDGEHTINGWVITLTNAQTTYNGLLLASARIIRSGIVQVAYPFTLVINETGVMPDTDSGLTIAQIDSYLLNIQNLVTGAVRQNTDAALSTTSENPVQNKVITTTLYSAIAGVYKVGGSYTIQGLEDLTKAESLNGYVYNCLDAGTLTNEDSTTVSVQEGDNVVFIWNNGSWHWDRMVGFIDTSNLVTLNGNQTITGEKTFTTGILTNLIDFGNNATITKDNSNRVNINYGGDAKLKIGASETICKGNFSPDQGNTYNLGRSGLKWNYAYVNYVSDGTNTIAVADIGKKLYKHTIQTDGGGGADLFIISTRSTAYTLPIDWLSLNTDAIKVLYNGFLVLRIYESSGNYYAQYIKDSNTITNSILSAATIEDIVTEL